MPTVYDHVTLDIFSRNYDQTESLSSGAVANAMVSFRYHEGERELEGRPRRRWLPRLRRRSSNHYSYANHEYARRMLNAEVPQRKQDSAKAHCMCETFPTLIEMSSPMASVLEIVPAASAE